ncbi:MAG: hypothetical protein ACE5JI_00945, partial [Acidobacteriota bacterium]
MPDRRRFSPALALVLAVVLSQLGLAVYLLQVRIDDRFGEYRATEDVLYITHGRALRKVVLGFESLAADLYWLRTVQYYGGKRLQKTNKRYDLLERLLDITTDLDPHLTIAYRYGAIFLSEPFPMGAGVPLKGIKLIDKGIANEPDYWRFYLDKGFIYFWYFQDYKKAAEVFLDGSKIPGAPYWMVATAGRTLTRGGDRETARHLWRVLYETAENEQMRYNAFIHLQQLDALDAVDALTEVARTFEKRTGRFPESWKELIALRLLNGVPADPSGVPYVLNP